MGAEDLFPDGVQPPYSRAVTAAVIRPLERADFSEFGFRFAPLLDAHKAVTGCATELQDQL
jgi:hypothetical protein